MSITSYSLLVGSLIYGMVCVRLDIAHAIWVVSHFMENPEKEHLELVKWIFKYLKGTSKLCLCFGNGKSILRGYIDANMIGVLNAENLHLGTYLPLQGELYHDNPNYKNNLHYPQQKLSILLLQKLKKKMLWLKTFLQDLGLKQDGYVVYCDSQSTIDLSKNSIYHY